MVSAGLGRLPWNPFPHTLVLSMKREYHEAGKLLFAAWTCPESGEGKLFGLGRNAGLVLKWKHRKCRKMDLNSETFWVHLGTADALDNCPLLVFGSPF